MDATARTQLFDTRRPWWLMVTMNTYRWRRLLSRLGTTDVEPLPVGIAVLEAWKRIPQHRPWVQAGEHVIMPDHFHGILRCGIAPRGRTGSIRHIIGGFKAEAVRLARASRALGRSERLWHRSYYLGILDTPEAAQRAARYIRNNPGVAIHAARPHAPLRRYDAR
ncbi:MAG: transposase [Gemmatimonadetes bacterium]|nr:transposase [Gemmatimonadota bacterium]MCB9517896.1 transposase [Gemmatimonadales bacterium]HRX18336.1 hypothetical protein [Gemmatimonadales bacterium]